MEQIFRALAEPNRLSILRLIRGREFAAGEIAEHFQITRTAISQHLRVLIEAGLISERREGTKRLYSLKPDGLDDLRSFVDEFWSDRLLALKHKAESTKEQENARRRR